jgi:hypothetical protein
MRDSLNVLRYVSDNVSKAAATSVPSDLDIEGFIADHHVIGHFRCALRNRRVKSAFCAPSLACFSPLTSPFICFS